VSLQKHRLSVDCFVVPLRSTPRNEGQVSVIAQRPMTGQYGLLHFVRNDEKQSFSSTNFASQNSSLRGVYDELRTESSEQYIHKNI
jgi:hypothetical protein